MKEWNAANGTVFSQVSKIMDVGRIIFRICNNKTLLVFIPGFFHDPQNFRQLKTILLQKTQDYINWVDCDSASRFVMSPGAKDNSANMFFSRPWHKA